jgi:hypothetical protein
VRHLSALRGTVFRAGNQRPASPLGCRLL